MSAIQFRRTGEWTVVYKDGELQMAGDHYHADEWLQELCNVDVVDDDAGDCMIDGHTAYKTLREVDEVSEARAQRTLRAAEMRREASEMLAEAERLETGASA